MAYTLIRNGTLIDGRGGTPVPNAAVLLNGSRIYSAGTEGAVTFPTSDLKEIDAKDAHIER